MADRDVSVTLRAKIDGYLSSMRQASAASGKVATDSQRNFQRLGGSMQSVGRSMTLGITTPLVGLAGASVGMASNFESAFARMQGLAGVSAGEIDSLRESVLGLAGETAVGPQELAEGLYFLRSSGLDADEALQALEMSAQASAAGLGSTAVIADAVSSAMNAYAASGLSAAEATDILTATARAGKAEPEQLAGALGRVLPIASELGITFEDVGGAIAALSLNGNDASTSATLLTNVMSKLLKPSQQGAEALAGVGLSTDSIRQSIQENGLLATLQMLQDKLGDAGFIKFMEDAQAVQGALSLVNDESGNVAAAFDNVADHAGATGEAFDAMAGTDAFKMKQALVDVQTAMITLGSVLLPIVADIASGIAGLAGWFTDLDPVVQKIVIGFGGVAAAGGPAVFVLGSLTKHLQTLGPKAATAAKAFGLIGLAVGTGVIIYDMFTKATREAEARTQLASDALEGATTRAWDYAAGVEAAGGEVDGFAVAQQAMSDALTSGSPEAEALAEALGALGFQASDATDIMLDFADNNVRAMTEMARHAGAVGGNAQILANYVDEVERLGSGPAFSNLTELFLGNSDAALAFIHRNQGVVDALTEVNKQASQLGREGLADMASAFLNNVVAASADGEALVELAEKHTDLDRNGQHSVSVYREFNEILENMTPTERAAALAAAGLSEETLAAANAATDAVPAFEDAGGAIADMEMVAASSIDTMSNMQDGWAFAETLIGAYSDGLDRALGTTRDWVRSHDDFAGSLLEFNELIEDASAGLEYNTEAGLANRDAVFDMADGVIELMQANIDAGQSTQEVTAEYEASRTALLDAAEAAGLDRQAVEDLITQYGLTPDLVTTTVELAGVALSQWRVDRWLEKLDEIDPIYATQIEAAMDMNDIDEAIRILNSIPDEDVRIRPRLTATHFNVSVNGGTSGFTVGISASAAGRYVDRPMLSTLGEGGRPEVVLPLTDLGRMSALLSMPQVGPAVAAAMPTQPSGASYTFGDINVGDRNDASPMVDALGKAMFMAKHAA